MSDKNIISGWKKQDGLLAWIICFSAFITQALIDGIDYSFGEAVGSIMKELDATASTAAWVASVHSTMIFVFAFVGSVLAKRFGFRVLIVIGTIVSCGAYSLAICLRDISGLLFSYGILGGIGSGLLYTPAHIIHTQYFTANKLAVATGLAASGTGFGIITLPCLANYVSNIYGYKGYFLMCAVVSPLSLIFGLAAVPLCDHYNQSNDKSCNQCMSEFRDAETQSENVPIIQQKAGKKSMKNDSVIEDSPVDTKADSLEHGDKRKSSSATQTHDTTDETDGKEPRNSHKQLFSGFALLKDARLYLYCLVHILFELAYFTPTDFLPEMMVNERGVLPSMKGSVISILGLGYMIGKTVCGILAHYVKNSCLLLSAISMALLGIGCIGYVFCSVYLEFVAVSMGYGICLSALDILAPLILIQNFGIDMLKDSFAMVMLAKVVASVWGSPIAGALHDLTNDYSAAFYTAGAFNITGSILCIIVMWLQKQREQST